jgi:hypothetical protein
MSDLRSVLKHSVFSLFLGILSYPSFAQYGGYGRSPSPSPAPAQDKHYKECAQHLNKWSKDLGIYNSIPNYCGATNFRKVILDRPDDLAACLAKVITFTHVKNELLKFCIEEKYAAPMQDEDYLSCLTTLKQASKGKDQFEVCLSKENQKRVKEEDFQTCFSIHRELNTYLSDLSVINHCKVYEKAVVYYRPEFNACREQLISTGQSEIESKRYCANSVNQRPENVGSLVACSKKVSAVTGKSGVMTCLDIGHTSSLFSPSNLLCVEKSSEAYLDPTYFSDETPFEINRVFKSFMYQCKSRNKVVAPSGEIEFVGVKYLSNVKSVDGTQVGGLSGITYDENENILKIVSDDPGFRSPSRLYNVVPDFFGNSSLDFKSSTPIKTTYVDKKTKFSYNIDAEGIALLPDGLMAISSETMRSADDSFLRIYDNQARFLSAVVLPEKFIPKIVKVEHVSKWEVQEWQDSGEVDRQGRRIGKYVWVEKTSVKYSEKQELGIQYNKAFEALTSVPGKSILFTANEAPLVQDKLYEGQYVRILRLASDEKGFFPDGEFLYSLEDKEDNGLVELVALDENRLLVLERRYNKFTRNVTASVFEVDLRGAKDYSSIVSLSDEDKERGLQPLKKKLLLNVYDIFPLLPEAFKTIDNFEGMSLGPKLPNGNQSLILVSDNNFSNDQVTQFLIFEIKL